MTEPSQEAKTAVTALERIRRLEAALREIKAKGDEVFADVRWHPMHRAGVAMMIGLIDAALDAANGERGDG